MQLDLFEGQEGFDDLKIKKSTDWKWTFADYPKEKNGLIHIKKTTRIADLNFCPVCTPEKFI